MRCDKTENDKINIYDETIDTSKEMSMQKAIAIFQWSQQEHKKVIHRPNINPKKGIVKIIIAVIALLLIGFLLNLLNVSVFYIIPLIITVFLINAKKAVIWMVLLYQKYAPEKLRASCLFTPSCSEYMILAIKKYGLLKGVFKGIKRLFRCHYPNGGTDNP